MLDRILAREGVSDVVITGNLAGAMSADTVSIDGAAPSFGAVRAKLADAIARLQARGSRVHILEQGPVFSEDVSSFALQNLRRGHAETLTLSREDFDMMVNQVQALSDLPDVYIDVAPFFCNETECPSVDAAGQIVIYDTNHVTRAYSAKLARFLFERAGL